VNDRVGTARLRTKNSRRATSAESFPGASMAGFGDVLALMVFILWLGHRWERKRRGHREPMVSVPTDRPRPREKSIGEEAHREPAHQMG
jgi:hypothetical protein